MKREQIGNESPLIGCFHPVVAMVAGNPASCGWVRGGLEPTSPDTVHLIGSAAGKCFT